MNLSNCNENIIYKPVIKPVFRERLWPSVSKILNVISSAAVYHRNRKISFLAYRNIFSRYFWRTVTRYEDWVTFKFIKIDFTWAALVISGLIALQTKTCFRNTYELDKLVIRLIFEWFASHQKLIENFCI